MKILITGGSGYFGTELNKYLSTLGYEVWSYDAGFFKDNWLGKTHDLNEKWIDSREITENDLRKYDSVIHFAGISNDPLKQVSEDEMHKPSILYTLDIAKMCKKLNKPFLFASSCSIYGFSQEIVNENSVPNPLTPYSRAKLDIENSIRSISDAHWQPKILRFATIYGFSSRMRFDTVINMFCGMAITKKRFTLNSNGQAVRPFLYIQDACKIIEFFMQPDIDVSELLTSENQLILNIGSTKDNYSINNVIQFISQLTNVSDIRHINNGLTEAEIFSDRKIHNGVDNRSYSVSFEKLEKYREFNFKQDDFANNIGKTLRDLNEVHLNYETFTKDEFYRLQFLESLIQRDILDQNLIFKYEN